MKKNQYIPHIILLIAVYCFGLSVSIGSISNLNIEYVKKSNEQNDFLSSFPKVFFTSKHQTEKLFSNVNDYAPINFDLSVDSCCPSTFDVRLFTGLNFNQYRNYHINQLINHRKSNLIFPFHNFW